MPATKQNGVGSHATAAAIGDGSHAMAVIAVMAAMAVIAVATGLSHSA